MKKKKKYPDGLKKKLTGFAETNKEELGIRGGVNYGGTKLSGDLSKYYKNLKLNQKIPIKKYKDLNINLGLESGNLTKFGGKRNFKPGFNIGFTKTFPDGKGKLQRLVEKDKKVVYVPDLKTLEKERQARTDSLYSHQDSEALRLEIEQQSKEYEKSLKELKSMTDDEYLEKGDSVEAENDRINDDSRANAKRLLNKIPDKYKQKGIEPSGSVTSPYLGKTMSFPTYSPPKTTVKLKKEEEEEKEEEPKVEKKKAIAVTNSIASVKPIVKKSTAAKPVEHKKKEEPKVDYKGKIKYIPDASGPVKYFFVDGSGRKIPLPEHEAKRRQKVNNTEIVKVMKNKKYPDGKGPFLKKANKGKYVLKKTKKYGLGVLATVAGEALGKGLGGSGATALGKTSNALGMAGEVTNAMGQYGIRGGEKANKIAGIFNNAADVTNTLDTSIQDKRAKKVEKLKKLNNTSGMGNAIKKGPVKESVVEGAEVTPEQGFRYGRMFPYGKGGAGKFKNTMEKDRKALEKEERKSMTPEQKKLKREVDKIKKQNVKQTKKQGKQLAKEKNKQKKIALRDTKVFEKENPSRDINYDEFTNGRKGQGITVKNRKVKEYR